MGTNESVQRIFFEGIAEASPGRTPAGVGR
jgi:hypothetical protein